MPIVRYLSDFLIAFGHQIPISLCIFGDDTQSSFYENIFCPYGKCEEEAYFITTVYATIINTHSNHYLKWEVTMVRLVKGENDLATVNPVLAKEWHPTKNENLNPEDITSGSSKEVWWLCPKGHPYSMVVNQRTKRGYGCPYCSGHRVLNAS